MSDAILWLERDGKRWALEPFEQILRWVSDCRERVACWTQRAALLPGGGNVNDDHAIITRDEAIALVRKYAPAFGYTVRERVVAGAWDADCDRVYKTDADWLAARVGPAGWVCWLDYDDGDDFMDYAGDASGPEAGPAGMAAADRWLTEHAPWVTLEGGAYTVPQVVPEPAPSAPVADDRLDALAARVAALEARVAVVEAPARDPRVDPRPGDVLWSTADGGTVYLVTKAENGSVFWWWVDSAGPARHMLDTSIEFWPEAFSDAAVLRAAP